MTDIKVTLKKKTIKNLNGETALILNDSQTFDTWTYDNMNDYITDAIDKLQRGQLHKIEVERL